MESPEEPRAAGPTRAERIAAGRAIRKAVPRSAHAGWTPPARRGDPLAVLRQQDRTRIPELVPIRYGRMAVSPFTFLRGSAAVMARDISRTPNSGIRVQTCGDCHLLNFGAYGTPERNLVFDVNDFDETLEAPFEWDLKRLAASIHVAARDNAFDEDAAGKAVLACMREYRLTMARLAQMTRLEVWYAHGDMAEIQASLTPDAQQRLARGLAKTRSRDNLHALRKLGIIATNGAVRIADQPPLVMHPPNPPHFDRVVARLLKQYRHSLQEDRRHLLDRYRFADTARKVVGVGSVGLDARIALFLGEDDHDPLFLQMKEARASVLSPYAGASPHSHCGRRVVEGQRLMQAASDIFLGWYTGVLGDRRHYYVRQLRDMKGSADIAIMRPATLVAYAGLCGATLARAHARGGDASFITGYLGSSDVFDRAIAQFACDYADQSKDDHARLTDAIASGAVTAVSGL